MANTSDKLRILQGFQSAAADCGIPILIGIPADSYRCKVSWLCLIAKSVVSYGNMVIR